MQHVLSNRNLATTIGEQFGLEPNAAATFAKKADASVATMHSTSISSEARRALLHANALRGISLFNVSLNHSRESERRTFFDMHTFTVHYPCLSKSKGTLKRAPVGPFDCDADDFARYPVALLDGQFAGPFRRFTPSDLRYLPVHTVLGAQETRNRHASNLDCSDENTCATQRVPEVPARGLMEDVLIVPAVTEESRNDGIAQPPETNADVNLPVEESEVADSNMKPEGIIHATDAECAFCDSALFDGDSVRCAICKRLAHYACFFVDDPSLCKEIKRYAWQCMECKLCERCRGNEKEELLIVCDRCDRTYHTFCLQLVGVPSGQWLCPVCTMEIEKDDDVALVTSSLDAASIKKSPELECKSQKPSKCKRRSSYSRRGAKRVRALSRSPKSSFTDAARNLNLLMEDVVDQSITYSHNPPETYCIPLSELVAQESDAKFSVETEVRTQSPSTPPSNAANETCEWKRRLRSTSTNVQTMKQTLFPDNSACKEPVTTTQVKIVRVRPSERKIASPPSSSELITADNTQDKLHRHNNVKLRRQLEDHSYAKQQSESDEEADANHNTSTRL